MRPKKTDEIKSGDIIRCPILDLGVENAYAYALVLGVWEVEEEHFQIMWLHSREADSISLETFEEQWEPTIYEFKDFDKTIKNIITTLEGLQR